MTKGYDKKDMSEQALRQRRIELFKGKGTGFVVIQKGINLCTMDEDKKWAANEYVENSIKPICNITFD